MAATVAAVTVEVRWAVARAAERVEVATVAAVTVEVTAAAAMAEAAKGLVVAACGCRGCGDGGATGGWGSCATAAVEKEEEGRVVATALER